MSKISNILHGSKPTGLMIVVQIVLTVVNIGYKLALNDGMPLSVLVAYRFMFGAAFILPVAFFVERFTLSSSFSTVLVTCRSAYN